MSDFYGGTITALQALIPVHVNIVSTSAANPIVVVTSAPHGCETGDTVVVQGAADAAAIGAFECLVLSATSLQLLGASSVIGGGAQGTLRCAGFGSDYTVPGDTDLVTAPAFNAAFEALGDRTALLFYKIQYSLQMHPGGAISLQRNSQLEAESGSQIFLDDGSKIFATLGSFLQGDLTIDVLSHLYAGSGGAVQIKSGGFFIADAGSTSNIFGTMNVQSGGQFINLAGGLIDIKGDGAYSPGDAGDMIFRSLAALEMKSGSVIQFDPGSTLLMNGPESGGQTINATVKGAAIVKDNCVENYLNGSTIVGSKTDNATNIWGGHQTAQGRIIHSGDDAFVGGRQRYLSSNASGTEEIDPSKYEVLVTGTTQSGNVIWKLDDPPNNHRIEVCLQVYSARLNGNNLIIHDSSGTTIFTFSSGEEWMDLRYEPDVASWLILRNGAYLT